MPQFARQPGASQSPVAHHGVLGDLQYGRSFFQAQSPEETQLNDSRLARVKLGQGGECLVQRDEVGVPFERRFVSLSKKENLAPDYLALSASGQVTQELDEKNLTVRFAVKGVRVDLGGLAAVRRERTRPIAFGLPSSTGWSSTSSNPDSRITLARNPASPVRNVGKTPIFGEHAGEGSNGDSDLADQGLRFKVVDRQEVVVDQRQEQEPAAFRVDSVGDRRGAGVHRAEVVHNHLGSAPCELHQPAWPPGVRVRRCGYAEQQLSG